MQIFKVIIAILCLILSLYSYICSLKDTKENAEDCKEERIGYFIISMFMIAVIVAILV